MKKLLALLFVLTFIFVLASCGNSQNPQDSKSPNSTQKATEEPSDQIPSKEMTFTVTNFSDAKFNSLKISLAGKNNWSENLISETLKPGDTATIKFNVPNDANERIFDMTAIREDSEDTVPFNHIDLTESTDKGGNIVLLMTEGGDTSTSFVPSEE